MSTLEQPISQQRRPARFAIFAIAVVVVMSGLTLRLSSMQLSGSAQPAGAPGAAAAESRRTALQPVVSTRGLIFDRAGQPPVANVPTFTVRVRPADLPLSRRPQVVERLAGLLETTPAAINTSLDSGSASRFDAVAIARDVPEATARLIAEDGLTLPGVEVTVEPRRDYLTGALMTQVLGYTGAVSPEAYEALAKKGYLADDTIGQAGLELTYEAELRGAYGTERVEKDGTGRTVRTIGIETPPTAGSSLVLTIDTKEQRLAEKALRWGLAKAGIKRGALVVLNPQTGEVLAMVSLPTYDANQFSRGITNAQFKALVDNPHKPLINHAIGDIQPPGSTYKLVTGLGGLADKIITPTSTLTSKPYVQLGATKFWEWDKRGWGPLDIIEGFGHSSDTYFYQLAHSLGIERLSHWARQLGFGSPTGVDLPFEAAGLVPTDQWKMDRFGQPIYPGEVLQAGIGQGFDLATVLQVANAYAAVANGGKLYQPQVVREVRDGDGLGRRHLARQDWHPDVHQPRILLRMHAQVVDAPAVRREHVRAAARPAHHAGLVDFIEIEGGIGRVGRVHDLERVQREAGLAGVDLGVLD